MTEYDDLATRLGDVQIRLVEVTGDLAIVSDPNGVRYRDAEFELNSAEADVVSMSMLLAEPSFTGLPTIMASMDSLERSCDKVETLVLRIHHMLELVSLPLTDDHRKHLQDILVAQRFAITELKNIRGIFVDASSPDNSSLVDVVMYRTKIVELDTIVAGFLEDIERIEARLSNTTSLGDTTC